MAYSSDTSEKAIQLHDKVKMLLDQGQSDEYIIGELEKEGIERYYAQAIIDNVHNDFSDRKNFWKLLFSGLFFIIGGLAINYFSYRMAADHNSLLFYLFWGIVVAGIVMIIRAFIIFRK